MRRLGAFKLASGAALLLLSAGGCLESRPGLPASAAVRTVTMSEYHFQHSSFPAGRVIFRVRNAGGEKHELRLVALPEGLPPIDVQLRSKKRQAVGNVAYVPPRAPGQTGTFAVDFRPGRYALICLLRARDGQPHALKGMTSEFTIG